MFHHPTIAAALAEQRRAALTAQAENARLARAARAGRTGRPARWFAPRNRPRVPATLPIEAPTALPPPPSDWIGPSRASRVDAPLAAPLPTGLLPPAATRPPRI